MRGDRVLFAAVETLGRAAITMSDSDMGQPFRWRAHEEGVRFALIGSYQELRELAVALAEKRASTGPRLTRAQRALAPYHAAYRELQALLLAVDDVLFDQKPAPGAWSLRSVLSHVVETERMFYALITYGALRLQQPDTMPAEFPRERREALAGPDSEFEAASAAGREALLAYYDGYHERILAELSTLDDDTLRAPSIWWEQEPLSLQYRMHRYDAHLRQHTVQIAQVLETVRGPQTEAQRLLAYLYQALAAVESACFGVPYLGAAARHALAEKIRARAASATRAVSAAHEIASAVAAGDERRVSSLLQGDRALAAATTATGLSLVEDALGRGHTALAETVASLCPELSIWDAACLGRLDTVQEYVAAWPGWATYAGPSGETALDKARRFGRHELVAWLEGSQPKG